jgi:hypothetical protein
MWKGIDCSSYPSWAGSEGDVCKVWYQTGPISYASKQGNWDPDDNACIINCNGKRESSLSDARDYCGSSGAGDSKCEQACGADPKCDEKDTLYDCGTNGKCTSDCTCCEASDSDGGEDYLVKGTTTGLVSSNHHNVLSCDTKTDYCWDSTTLVEYYVTSDKYLNWRSYSCSLRNDGNVRCIDGRCGCLYDSDCPPGGPNNLVKGKCDSPSGTDNPDTSGYTYTCYWMPCKKNEECVDNSCCVTSSQDSNKANQGKCVSQGIYSNNPKWLCDPPNGWASNRIEPEAKTQNILEVILDFFSHFLQR